MGKSKWEDVKSKLDLIECWARDGLTDEQIYYNLGISKNSFYVYKKEHKELNDTLKRGKEIVDYEVENALLKKALGHHVKVKKVYKLKFVDYNPDNGRKVKEYEELQEAEELIYIPPDTMAQIYWLNNRKPKEWRKNSNKEKLEKEKFEHQKVQDEIKNF